MKDDEQFPPIEDDDTRSFVEELFAHAHRTSGITPKLAGGDIDARWDEAEASGEEAACGSCATPDQSIVEEIGEAWGIIYQAGEELKIGIKERDRDRHRWELDPASAEDYRERERVLTGSGPSEPVLHMTHEGQRPHKAK